jgi:hypothetical protein
MAEGKLYPSRPADTRDAGAMARYTAELIEVALSLKLSSQTVQQIKQHLYRVGPSNHEDLAASIFLECWEAKNRVGSLDEQEVRRAADRVRQRIIRGLKDFLPAGSGDHIPAEDWSPEDEVALVSTEFQNFLERRSALEALLFQRYYLDAEKNIPKLATDLGIAVSTVYRRLKAIRDDYLAMRRIKGGDQSTA